MDQPNQQVHAHRHQKLINLINNYSLTQQEEQYLQTIKKQTEIEIALRFKKSQHNRNYKFPLKEDSQDHDASQFPGRVSFEQTFYDLNVQNYVFPSAQRIQDRSSRRIKSLGPEKSKSSDIKFLNRDPRPQQRSSRRQKFKLPSIMSSKLVCKTQQKQQSLKRISPSRRLIKIQSSNLKHNAIKGNRQQVMGKILVTKLLTQEGETFRFGKTKILIENNRIYSPIKAPKAAKLMTQL